MTSKTRERSENIVVPLLEERQNEILKVFQKSGKKWITFFVVIKRWTDNKSITDRKRSGRPRNARTLAMVKALKTKIRRTPDASNKN
jgi:hypothetical protein